MGNQPLQQRQINMAGGGGVMHKPDKARARSNGLIDRLGGFEAAVFNAWVHYSFGITLVTRSRNSFPVVISHTLAVLSNELVTINWESFEMATE